MQTKVFMSKVYSYLQITLKCILKKKMPLMNEMDGQMDDEQI